MKYMIMSIQIKHGFQGWLDFYEVWWMVREMKNDKKSDLKTDTKFYMKIAVFNCDKCEV